MEDVLKHFKDIVIKQNQIAYEPFAERVATIEHRQKTYDTSLLTQAKMIGDLQTKTQK